MRVATPARLHVFCISALACSAIACGDSSPAEEAPTVTLLDMAIAQDMEGADAVDMSTAPDLPEQMDPDMREEEDMRMAEDMRPEADVAATFRVINPAMGGGFEGVTVTGPQNVAVTEGQGRATVTITPGAYQVALDAPGARTHTVFGVANDADFEQITYVSPDMITGFVYNQLGLMDDPTKGILVVGLDLPSLAPAVGAQASIDADSDAPFVFAGMLPSATDTIPSNGQGFVTFPNVTPGEVTITTMYPNGTCRVFPAETDANAVTVTAGEVSVMAFTCRSN